jgi:DNA-directed RNA polymerase subunit beta'
MSINLDLQTKNLKVSDETKEALNLLGLLTLKEFNTFDLNDFNSLLSPYESEVKDEVIGVLRKYGLPQNLNSLGLSQDAVGALRVASINNTFEFLNAKRGVLYQIFKNDEENLTSVNNVLTYFQIEPLSIADYDEKLEILQSQQSVSDIDLSKRIQTKVVTKRKGYGSRIYSHFKIRIASPEEIRKWSYGEVLNHETINYRTSKPEPDGLFCERIFGPTKNYQCNCGKKQTGNKGQICPKCGIEITEALVRRERMGHIELEAPVVHTWYLKNSPSRLAILLGIKAKHLEQVVYYASYIVTDPGAGLPVHKKQILSEQEYSLLRETYGNRFEALTGAEAVKRLLTDLDLDKEVRYLRNKYKTSTKQKRERIIRRLEVVEAFNQSDNKPEWMVMDVIPVIPPELRPMVALEGGRFATTDLNDLYRRILNRNNRLKKQMTQFAARLIIKNEKRLLQEAVDTLFDNAKRGNRAVMERNRSLKSLSDALRGKQGRF